jgi:hypothetical protein
LLALPLAALGIAILLVGLWLIAGANKAESWNPKLVRIVASPGIWAAAVFCALGNTAVFWLTLRLRRPDAFRSDLP